MTRDEAIDAWAAMTAEERLAMAETAPEVAEAWEQDGDTWMRRPVGGWPNRVVTVVRRDASGWFDEFGPPEEEATATREEACLAVDLRLKQEGWILK